MPPGGAHRALAQARRIERGRPSRDPAGRAFVYNGRSFRAFRASPYVWPAGYRFRPMFVGGYLAPVFWSPNYFVVDYGDYGVEPPPPDYGWIRYGPDLLLMQLDTGEIAETVPGMFENGGSGEYGPAPASADAPPGFAAGPDERVTQAAVTPSLAPPYPTEPPAEAPPAFRYIGTPAFTGDPDELPGDPPPPGGAD